eukprot:COSAG04_NODE_608_length_12095_cov_54.626709_9_plen_208_part_00
MSSFKSRKSAGLRTEVNESCRLRRPIPTELSPIRNDSAEVMAAHVWSSHARAKNIKRLAVAPAPVGSASCSADSGTVGLCQLSPPDAVATAPSLLTEAKAPRQSLAEPDGLPASERRLAQQPSQEQQENEDKQGILQASQKQSNTKTAEHTAALPCGSSTVRRQTHPRVTRETHGQSLMACQPVKAGLCNNLLKSSRTVTSKSTQIG